MKKTFPFQDPPHKPPRVIERIKAEVRKYLRRENRKALPEEADFWDFDCRSGRDASSAEKLHVSELTAAIDDASKQGWEAVYIEILARPGHRRAKPEGEA